MATETKWTPGPWRLVWWGNEKYPFPLSILADNDGAWITRDGTASSEANARLIAAAPDLYEALKGVLTAIETVGETLGDMDAMRAALAKAEGRT